MIDRLKIWINYNVIFWEIVKERKSKLGAFDIDRVYYDVYYIENFITGKRVFLDFYRKDGVKKLTQREVYLANKMFNKLD